MEKIEVKPCLTPRRKTAKIVSIPVVDQGTWKCSRLDVCPWVKGKKNRFRNNYTYNL